MKINLQLFNWCQTINYQFLFFWASGWKSLVVMALTRAGIQFLSSDIWDCKLLHKFSMAASRSFSKATKAELVEAISHASWWQLRSDPKLRKENSSLIEKGQGIQKTLLLYLSDCVTVTCGSVFSFSFKYWRWSLAKIVDGFVRKSRKQSTLCLPNMGNFSAKVPRPWKEEQFHYAGKI